MIRKLASKRFKEDSRKKTESLKSKKKVVKKLYLKLKINNLLKSEI